MQPRGYFLVHLTPGISYKYPKSVYPRSLRRIGNKPIGDQVFMLDEWEVRSYMISPSPLPIHLKWPQIL